MTLCFLIVGVVNGRTINLSHLASQFPGEALHASSYRRLQRFFQYTRFDGDTLAKLMNAVLGQNSKRYLALDRTTWFFGRRVVNVLVLAIVTQRFRVGSLRDEVPNPAKNEAQKTQNWPMARLAIRHAG